MANGIVNLTFDFDALSFWVYTGQNHFERCDTVAQQFKDGHTLAIYRPQSITRT